MAELFHLADRGDWLVAEAAGEYRMSTWGVTPAERGFIHWLLSFTGSHRSANAAVEAQVRIIHRQLGLPPPENG